MKQLVIGVILGILLLGIARFFLVPPEQAVHHHANWAVFIDGERVDLSADHYMEDVSACYAATGEVTPASRVHMHENNQDVVHVHHGGATWGHLMQNLDFGMGDGWLVSDDGTVYEDGEGGTLKFVLNGRGLTTAHSAPIRSGDRLLISYGPQSLEEILESQYTQVASNAVEYNARQDPATCSGGHEPMGLMDRLKNAFWG